MATEIVKYLLLYAAAVLCVVIVVSIARSLSRRR